MFLELCAAFNFFCSIAANDYFVLVPRAQKPQDFVRFCDEHDFFCSCGFAAAYNFDAFPKKCF